MLTLISIIVWVLVLWILVAMWMSIVPAAILLWEVVFEKDNDKLMAAARKYKGKNPISGIFGFGLVYAQCAFNKRNRTGSLSLLAIITVGVTALLLSTWNKMCWTWFFVLLAVDTLAVIFLVRFFKKHNNA